MTGDLLQMFAGLSLLGVSLGWGQPDEGGALGVAAGVSLLGTYWYWTERADPDRVRRRPPVSPTKRGTRLAKAGIVTTWAFVGEGVLLLVLHLADSTASTLGRVVLALWVLTLFLQVALALMLMREITSTRRSGEGSDSL